MTDLRLAKVHKKYEPGDMAAIAIGLRTMAAATGDAACVSAHLNPTDARTIARAIEASLAPPVVQTRIVEVPVENPLSRSAVLFFVFMLGLQALGTLGDIALAIVRALP